MKPKVSVLMAAYNEEKYLRDAVDSILGQTFTDFEFIIVDDASTDTTHSILDSYNDPRLVCIRLEQNQGSAVARNKGLSRAQGEYIAIQDADDLSLPDRLAYQVEYLDQNPQVGIVGSAIIITDEEGVLTIKEIQHELIRNVNMCHGSVMFRRICLEKIGYYRPFFHRSQDRDLRQRMTRHYESAKLPQPLYQYRLVASKRTVRKVIVQCRYDLLVDKANQQSDLMNNADALRALGELMLRPRIFSSQWWYGHQYIARWCRYYGRLFFLQRRYGLALQHYAASFFLNPVDHSMWKSIIRLLVGEKIIHKVKQARRWFSLT